MYQMPDHGFTRQPSFGGGPQHTPGFGGGPEHTWDWHPLVDVLSRWGSQHPAAQQWYTQNIAPHLHDWLSGLHFGGVPSEQGGFSQPNRFHFPSGV